MSDLRELYQEVILDHGKNPRNFHALTNANFDAEGFNPLCGDKLHVYIHADQEKIIEVSFDGCGCAISTASASLMTEIVKGKPIEDALALFEQFHHQLLHDDRMVDLGKLNILLGVKQFPMRVKCATLAWHTLKAALQQQTGTVSTE